MSVIALSVEFEVGGVADPGLTRLTTAVERAGAELAKVGKHVLPKLIPLLEDSVKVQFAAEGTGPQAGSWAALSAPYSHWKSLHFPGQPKLVATGALRDALTNSGAPGAVRSVSDDALEFGTSGVGYASYHQKGTRHMPARPLFDFGREFEDGMQAAVMAGVREAVREATDAVLDVEGSAT